MKRASSNVATIVGSIVAFAMAVSAASGQWVQRDHRWPTRGPWMWAIPRELPQLYREFNGIDFGHAHLAQTLLTTLDEAKVERARSEVLDFIFSSPSVPPDEEQITPDLTRLVWETQRTFNWAHSLHRSLYDLFASDKVHDKENAYRKILADYLDKPEAITPHHLDHMGKLWSFPESKAFRDKFRKFNTQIWAYHWLQGAAYDVQLMGNAEKQRQLFPRIIEHYHGYLRNPPVEWQMMPMLHETAPEFTSRFPEAAAIFDNLHMLHDNLDDVLCRPDLYPSLKAKRKRILEILPIYLHRNHTPHDRYHEYHGKMMAGGMKHGDRGEGEHGKKLDEDLKGHEQHAGEMKDMGARPPSAKDVLEGKPSEHGGHEHEKPKKEDHHGHGGH